MENKMYACFAFFANGDVKRWKYVRDLKSFAQFLSKDHPSWKYFNVYDKGTKQYLKRFYPGNSIPKVLSVFLIGLFGLALTTKKPPMKNTFTYLFLNRIPTKHTFNKTTFRTFTNGIYYYATIPTPKGAKKEGLCS
jgi:hypothetical protein